MFAYRRLYCAVRHLARDNAEPTVTVTVHSQHLVKMRLHIMSSLSSLLLLSALAAASDSATQPAEQPLFSGPASLSFVSDDQALIGVVYGIAAIDSQSQAYGQRLSANILAGRRTVWYACPNEPAMAEGSRITFDFVAGHHYELVCQPAREAVIRAMDEC